MKHCTLCQNDFDNNRKLSKHLKHAHQISLKDYYDLHNPPKFCVICGDHSRYENYDLGYSDTCASKVCSAINYRNNLRLDEKRFNAFRTKVSLNQSSIWANRDNSAIRKKISETRKRQMSLMSRKERQLKFTGSPNGHISSIKNWWKTATEEQKASVYERRFLSATETKSKMYGMSSAETEKFIETMDLKPGWLDEIKL